MKKISTMLIAFAFAFCFSCSFGVDEFFYRDDQVHKRSRNVVDVSGYVNAHDLPSHGRFSVAVITDVHVGAESFSKEFEYFQRYILWLKNKMAENESLGFPVQFVACLGDLTYNGSETDYRNYSLFAKEIERQTGLKVYSTVGNHDIYNSGFQYYLENIYPHESSYRFETKCDIQNVSWYFLDSANGTFGKPQLESIKKEMENDPNLKIVCSHYPIYAGGYCYYTLQNVDERDYLLSVFSKNNVRLYMAGHCHIVRNSYDFSNSFTEKVFESSVINHNAAIVRYDISTGQLFCDRETY